MDRTSGCTRRVAWVRNDRRFTLGGTGKDEVLPVMFIGITRELGSGKGNGMSGAKGNKRMVRSTRHGQDCVFARGTQVCHNANGW
jgi:hypothetical protein